MQPVNFTRSAAERISRAVKAFELGDRSSDGPSIDRPWSTVGAGFRLQLGTFTGNWETGTFNTVTLTGTTNTVSVFNWCNPVVGSDTANSSQSRYVIFGKVAGTQSAVELQMRHTSTQCQVTMTIHSLDLKSLQGYDAGSIQLLGHSAQGTAACSGGLQWYSITTCSTAA